MSKVRSVGNRSTELKVRMALVRGGLAGWVLHARDVEGKPDFWFPRQRLAIFVDGCFWHGCPKCLRMPSQNRRYWASKIAGNVLRANVIRRSLRRRGVAVLCFWEHQLRTSKGLREVILRVRAHHRRQRTNS
jgi:DNA mismatch endonuclease, patch repair protein